ncbi:hypothetical protein CYLTODRAFT_444201 [Cylindrobasidium torrendii FP15055 ss-10]|uniref:Calcineurin-like phosphoesterase domain-containing protein n=1 Tax=Cylindrobasidium torrendii FP15055 ss-10 TaxID=1314674 RepID=A0A0D7BA87_9AGAR|nr:hypothetical protein CYLTODRAFT_444201 [Cylindrobasidium torrendii FP15055 ss-10]
MAPNERRAFQPAWRPRLARPLVVNGLRIFWAFIVLWGELGLYFWSISACQWPDARLQPSERGLSHVMLIADPQVKPVGAFSEETWTKWMAEYIFDSNVKRSWHAAKRLRPDVVIFLGDMLSAGKYVRGEKEYEQYYQKFKATFPASSNTTTFFVPGNNDIGMGVSHALSNKVRSHYFKTFGPFNYRTTIHDHQFVFVDAPGLVDEDYTRSAKSASYEEWTPISGGPVEFVKSVSIDEHPLVLLSHIPLGRPEAASCGPLREKGTIKRGVGHGYQNTLGKHTTSLLLKTLRPSIIFSADNRDYCEITHRASVGERDASKDVREVTVKSFSMARGINYPGLQLLSLTDPTSLIDQPSFADTMCALPSPKKIFDHFYIPLIFLTIIGLFVVNYTSRTRTRQLAPVSILTPVSPLRHNQRSPPARFPAKLRTPNSRAEATFRASQSQYLDGTPLGSPMFHADMEEDVMFPSQYANRGAEHDDAWSPDTGIMNGFGDPEPPVASTPVYSYSSPSSGGWTWSFVLLGQRRRITLRLPDISWEGAKELIVLLGAGHPAPRKGVFQSTVIDVLSVAWPALLLWVFLMRIT